MAEQRGSEEMQRMYDAARNVLDQTPFLKHFPSGNIYSGPMNITDIISAGIPGKPRYYYEEYKTDEYGGAGGVAGDEPVQYSLLERWLKQFLFSSLGIETQPTVKKDWKPKKVKY